MDFILRPMLALLRSLATTLSLTTLVCILSERFTAPIYLLWFWPKLEKGMIEVNPSDCTKYY